MTSSRLIRSPSDAVAILLLALLLGLPWLDASLNLLPDPFDISFETFEGPSVSHPLGTSDGGTDILSELSAGLRRSCAFGLLTAAAGTALAFFAGRDVWSSARPTSFSPFRPCCPSLRFPPRPCRPPGSTP